MPKAGVFQSMLVVSHAIVAKLVSIFAVSARIAAEFVSVMAPLATTTAHVLQAVILPSILVVSPAIVDVSASMVASNALFSSAFSPIYLSCPALVQSTSAASPVVPSLVSSELVFVAVVPSSVYSSSTSIRIMRSSVSLIDVVSHSKVNTLQARVAPFVVLFGW